MKLIPKKTGVAALMLVALAPAVQAAPLDLSSWTELTLDFPGGQGAGNWILEPGNTARGRC